jgi:hypothetical protein
VVSGTSLAAEVASVSTAVTGPSPSAAG